MALKADRIVAEKVVPHAPEFGHGVAAGFRVYRGGIVAVCADGTIVPAGATGTPSQPVAIAGLARQFKDNGPGASVLNGDMAGPHPIWVKKGCYALPFDAVPTWANVGQPVYAVDDETVSLSSGEKSAPASGESSSASSAASTRLQVGTLAGFELDGTPYVLIV